MVSMGGAAPGSGSSSLANGVVLPTRYFILLIVTLTALIALQVKSFLIKFGPETQQVSRDHHEAKAVVYHESKPVLRNPKDQEQCRFYLAESAVAPGAGMGMFTATGLLQNDMIGFPDICIFVSDAPKKWTHLRSHSWGWGNFFGQYEGGNSRAACEGYATIFNTMPDTHINTKLVSPIQQTTANVRRDKEPAAGAITHHYGIHSVALDVIPAGSELTINYGDWDFDEEKEYKRPKRTPEWLAENGWCIDHIEVMQSSVKGIGRGAFVKRNLPAGTLVAPAPLQVFKDRKVFQTTNPEQLYVNYCMQPRNSKMLVYPYGPGVNLINHSSKSPNVHLQWSTNYMHKKELLDMDYDEFWKNVNPGSLVLEIVASRDLVAGEELFLDYGREWEAAWEQHVAKWEPLPNAQSYVYPEDMDETAVLRTVKEQETEPYPQNLITMCFTPEWDRKENKHVEWYEPEWDWAQGLVFCNILDRQTGADGNDEYTVSLNFFDVDVSEPLVEEEIAYDPSVAMEDLLIDTKVPRRAIRWIEKPYLDDEHLPNAFRHPIGLPDNLVPEAWRTAV